MSIPEEFILHYIRTCLYLPLRTFIYFATVPDVGRIDDIQSELTQPYFEYKSPSYKTMETLKKRILFPGPILRGAVLFADTSQGG